MAGWVSKMLGRAQPPSDPIPEAEAASELVETLKSDVVRYRKEARCRQIIGIAISRYFIKGERGADVAIPFEEVTVDSNPEWMPEILQRKEVSEPEFSIFRYFAGDSNAILDIGASYGYAAASIWAAGATCRILSFEPNPWNLPCLKRIKELRPGLYDFMHIGLGSNRGYSKFVIPVLEGIGLSSLGSAFIEGETDWTIPENVLLHMMQDHPGLEAPRLQFTEVVWQTDRLDDVLASRDVDIDLSIISAIKIDVEGSEPDVLVGAKETLRAHKPLIMIEGANRNPAVVGPLSSLGYRFAEFVTDGIVLSERQSTRSNGFFIHEEKLSDYWNRGMLRS